MKICYSPGMPKPEKTLVRRMNPDEVRRRERILKALYKAERDLTPGEICEATGIYKQGYSQFKAKLILGRRYVDKLEAFLVGKGHLPRPPREPFPTVKPPALREIKEMAAAIRQVAEDTLETGCSAAQLAFLKTGVHQLSKLVDKVETEIEEGIHDTTSSPSH